MYYIIVFICFRYINNSIQFDWFYRQNTSKLISFFKPAEGTGIFMPILILTNWWKLSLCGWICIQWHFPKWAPSVCSGLQHLQMCSRNPHGIWMGFNGISFQTLKFPMCSTLTLDKWRPGAEVVLSFLTLLTFAPPTTEERQTCHPTDPLHPSRSICLWCDSLQAPKTETFETLMSI